MRFDKFLIKILFLTLTVCAGFGSLFAQNGNTPTTAEVIIVEETPPILQHLPDWKNVQDRATYIPDKEGLLNTLGARPVFDLIQFEGGTEAATANYDAGKLLIVEYSTPQFSIDADNRIKQFFETNQPTPPVYFKRIGNYEVFVFDATDEDDANELIEKVKYEKNVQWLGKDPYLYQKAERAYIKVTSEVFISSFKYIGLGLLFAITAGLAAGMLVFYLRKQKKAAQQTFTDAGGMVRLNLDELTADIGTTRMLKD